MEYFLAEWLAGAPTGALAPSSASGEPVQQQHCEENQDHPKGFHDSRVARLGDHLWNRDSVHVGEAHAAALVGVRQLRVIHAQ